jgi:hypothetical protein|tara:strand:+ start:539 stop:919 length:381 start_codon:yes stop_codon:yes gene_type:complete
MKLNTFLTILSVSGFLVAESIAGRFSLNFDGQSGTGTPGAVTGVAGAIAVGNWNNTGQGNANNVGPLDLVDDSGATANWSGANHWTTNGGDNRSRPNGFQITQIPEPSSMLLFLLGSAGIFIRRRR